MSWPRHNYDEPYNALSYIYKKLEKIRTDSTPIEVVKSLCDDWPVIFSVKDTFDRLQDIVCLFYNPTDSPIENTTTIGCDGKPLVTSKTTIPPKSYAYPIEDTVLLAYDISKFTHSIFTYDTRLLCVMARVSEKCSDNLLQASKRGFGYFTHGGLKSWVCYWRYDTIHCELNELGQCADVRLLNKSYVEKVAAIREKCRS